MPSRTDDPPRTTPPRIAADPASPSVTSPPVASAGARPAASPSNVTTLTHESFRAILSAHQRAGRWEVADEIEVQAILGAVSLDFTRAELPPSGIIEIDALAFAGSVQIILPDGADVEIEGTPIVGSIEQKVPRKRIGEAIRERVTGERAAAPPARHRSGDPPFFRIECRAIAGSIEVVGR